MTNLKTAVFTSNNPEKELLISRAYDIIDLSSVRHKNCYLGFLNESEIYSLKELLHIDRSQYCFWGGYENAKRKMFCYLYEDFNSFEVPISALEFSFNSTYKLSHRDFLGTILSLGLERSTLGDILVESGRAVLFVKNDVKEYITSQITKIGGVGVKIKEADLSNIPQVDDIAEKTLTIASLRLDVLVSAFTGISREKSQKIITQSLVSVNYSVCNSTSLKLKEDDIIVVRKYGKFIVKNIISETKKGRLKLLVQYYR